MNFKIDDKGRSQTQNDTKIADLTKTLESKLRAFVPTAGDELQERKDLQKGLLSQEFLLASMSVTLILLTNESHQKKHVAAASTSFSSAGLELMPIGILQAQAVMSSLPFQMLNYRND
ncbi:type IV secretion system protein TraC, partial [Vibrio sp. 10N.261.48.A2]